LNRKRPTAKDHSRSFEKPDQPPAADSHPPLTPLAVLQELYELLEEYAPIWYTQELHDRAEAALAHYKKTA
jgi:hypothetical protein